MVQNLISSYYDYLEKDFCDRKSNIMAINASRTHITVVDI